MAFTAVFATFAAGIAPDNSRAPNSIPLESRAIQKIHGKRSITELQRQKGMDLRLAALVGIGGAIGAVARYALQQWLPADTLPWGTITANLVGYVLQHS